MMGLNGVHECDYLWACSTDLDTVCLYLAGRLVYCKGKAKTKTGEALSFVS